MSDKEFTRPKFSQQIDDVVVTEGEDATFVCRLIAQPLPRIKW